MARAYCNFSSAAAKAAAGKDIIVGVFTTDDVLLALGGQRDFTLNRSAETVDTASKDTQGGWSSSVAGMKEWSIDNDGLFVPSDQSHSILSQAFENSDPVCIKVVDGKRKVGMFGGLAVVTDYPIEAPHDDAVTYSITLSGMGPLVDLSTAPVEPDTMPDGSAALESLTVVSVAGASSGQTSIYVNPILEASDKYFYRTGTAPLEYPSYGETISETSWDGTSPISGLTAGNQIMIIETDAEGKALKAGVAEIIVKTD